MKGDQMGTCIAYPTQRELPLSNWTWFSTTAGLCALFCLWWRRCGAMSSRSNAEHWAQELEAVAGRIAPQFGRAEPRRRALTYLQGLLAPLERKNAWSGRTAGTSPRQPA